MSWNDATRYSAGDIMRKGKKDKKSALRDEVKKALRSATSRVIAKASVLNKRSGDPDIPFPVILFAISKELEPNKFKTLIQAVHGDADIILNEIMDALANKKLTGSLSKTFMDEASRISSEEEIDFLEYVSEDQSIIAEALQDELKEQISHSGIDDMKDALDEQIKRTEGIVKKMMPAIEVGYRKDLAALIKLVESEIEKIKKSGIAGAVKSVKLLEEEIFGGGVKKGIKTDTSHTNIHNYHKLAIMLSAAIGSIAKEIKEMEVVMEVVKVPARIDFQKGLADALGKAIIKISVTLHRKVGEKLKGGELTSDEMFSMIEGPLQKSLIYYPSLKIELGKECVEAIEAASEMRFGKDLTLLLDKVVNEIEKVKPSELDEASKEIVLFLEDALTGSKGKKMKGLIGDEEHTNVYKYHMLAINLAVTIGKIHDMGEDVSLEVENFQQKLINTLVVAIEKIDTNIRLKVREGLKEGAFGTDEIHHKIKIPLIESLMSHPKKLEKEKEGSPFPEDEQEKKPSDLAKAIRKKT